MTCYRPVRLIKRLGEDEYASELFVPCGKCYACLQNRQQDWVNRMLEEEKHSQGAFFLTLTYDDDNLPHMFTNMFGYSESYSYEKGFVYEAEPTLVKDDLQKFMKRLRKHIKCRYFACGEYGSTTCRPHYHVCLFLSEYADLATVTDFVDRSWSLGFSMVSALNEQRMAYCAKYLVKGGKYPEHSVKPFCLMSRKPGIGESYIDKQSYNYHLSHPFLTKPGGIRQRLPRYWKTKMSLSNDGVIVDAMELEYLKTHDDLKDYGSWLKSRIEHHEERIEKRLKRDLL